MPLHPKQNMFIHFGNVQVFPFSRTPPRAIILIVLIFTPFGHPTGVHFIFLTNGPWELQVELQSAIYRHLVFLLLLRRKRKLRFLISNFKHSTGLFELALPD